MAYDILAIAAHPDDIEVVGVEYAETFRCRSPLLIKDLNTVGEMKFG